MKNFDKVTLDDPVLLAEFLDTLANSLEIAQWTWPIKPLRSLSNELVEIVPRKR
jgi:hypothetical protein